MTRAGRSTTRPTGGNGNGGAVASTDPGVEGSSPDDAPDSRSARAAPGEAARPDSAASGATRYGPLESVVRKPIVALFPLVLFVGIAMVLGIIRQPVYTGGAQLIVGGVVREFEPASGQVAAIQELTDIYSRLVGSTSHLDKVNAALGAEVPTGALAAAPIPNSPIIRLEATASDPDEAVARADAGAEQLVSYVQELRARALAQDQQLLQELTAASAELTAAELDRDAKRATYNAAVTNQAAPATQEAARQAYVAAEAAASSAQLKVDVASANYSSTESARRGGIGLSVFSPAEQLGSDRMNQLMIYLIAAVLLGGLTGMALATLVANRWQILPPPGRPTAA